MLVSAELLWRSKHLRGEAGRKLVHIGIGTYAAFWPYYLSWQQIELLAVGGLALVLFARRVHNFHVGQDVRRRSLGEVFFPIAIGVGALIQPPAIVFTAGMLHLSLADGFAALVGKEYGLLHQYRVRHYTKTLAGSLTFMFVSLTIITVTILLSTNGLSVALLPLIFWLPIAATILENISPYGLDNLLVPLFVMVILQAAQIS